MKLRYFRQIFKKYPHINFNNIPSSEGRDVPCGRTDGQAQTQRERKTYRHDKANSYFCNFANAPKDRNSGNRPTISDDSPVQSNGLKKQTKHWEALLPKNSQVQFQYLWIFLRVLRDKYHCWLSWPSNRRTHRQTDSYDEANSHVLHFANAHENSLVHFLQF